MRTRSRLGALALASLSISGCAFQGQHAFAATRKLVGSDAPLAAQVFMVPFFLIGDMLVSPVTAYMDAAYSAPEDEHLYLSFLGMRELWGSKLGVGYAIVGSLLTAPIDLAWFPVAAIIDASSAMAADEPPRTRTLPPPPPHDDDTPTGRRSGPKPQPSPPSDVPPRAEPQDQ